MTMPVSLLTLVLFWMSASPALQKAPKPQKPDPVARPGYLLFTDPDHRFSVEFPKDWRWLIVAGSREALATFIQPNDEAAVIVEHFKMRVEVPDSDIDATWADVETKELKDNQPRARNIAAKFMTERGKPMFVVDYERPGVGEPGKVEDQRVRQFSFPQEGYVYRITCTALSSKFAKYEAGFQVVKESFKTADQLVK